MCLLDDVLSWDASRIRCRSASHRTPDNPLRAHGRLGAACGIEYAAQAMAVHGALVGASAPLASTMAINLRAASTMWRSATSRACATCFPRRAPG
jgi:predicted hotdog family 3-hydroxylacyl-ACP dehydratase